MKLLLTTLVILTGLFAPSLAVAEEGVKYGDLVKRERLYYKPFTEEPFTGKTVGLRQITFRRGKIHGSWASYYLNGQLWFKEIYKDGKLEGPSVIYWSNGQLKGKGTYKDSKRDGPWVYYKRDGTTDFDGEGPPFHEGTGTYRKGKKVSD
jgi:antitoxin component YwqK of YwqJK toxin-antitoxin module